MHGLKLNEDKQPWFFLSEELLRWDCAEIDDIEGVIDESYNEIHSYIYD